MNDCFLPTTRSQAGPAGARFVFAVLVCAWATGGPASAEEPVNFNRDVRPILSENCYACHGFDEATREAGLRLDLREQAIADLGGYSAIMPGDAVASEAWKRIISTDPKDLMPPPESHLVLNDEQKDILRRWIDQGAEYTEHWAFVAPERPPVPEIEGRPDVSPVDAFLLERMIEEGLEPNAAADRAMLMRRVTLDLTGLPPSAEDVAAHLNDPRSDDEVYAELVERLLASPHYGERMALDWMDASRYADTNGFSIDGGRHMWVWRDWVIDAFNRNLPYNQFIIEQIAGDKLPDRTEAQLIATGFQRNNMVTHEGGTIPEENLANYNADRVQTLGEALLGLSLNCAQCHDHKYDPISQKDYYQLFAYFNTLGDRGLDGNSGVNPGPSVNLRSVLETGEEEGLRQRISELEQELAQPDMTLVSRWLGEQMAELDGLGEGFDLHPLELLNVITPNTGAGFDIVDAEVDGETIQVVQFSRDINAAFDVSMRLPENAPPITGLRFEFLPRDPEQVKDGHPASLGYGRVNPRREDAESPTTFALNAVAVSMSSVSVDQVDLHRQARLVRATASNWQGDNRPEAVLDARTHGAWVPVPETDSPAPAHLTVSFDEPVDPAATPFMTTQVYFGWGRSLSPYRFRVFAMSGTDTDSTLPPDIRELVEMDFGTLDDDQRGKLITYATQHASQFEPQRIELANLRERLDVVTKAFPVMVMQVAEQPRDTFILHRGDYSQPADQVFPGTPGFLPELDLEAVSARYGMGVDIESRLALAEWLVMEQNPLTARVAVNRMWHLLFGTGIVATIGDFGAQSEWPSHPELLDWLAVEFRETGWDVKDFIRMLVMTDAYRRDSSASREQLEQDFDNRLLARGPRFRLKAEHIRDHALAVSGLLVPRLGGPSVNPYKPGDLWREVSHYGSTPATAQTFVQDRGEKLYRRSLYTFWKRTVPPPNMAAFDAPNREVCTVSRPLTNTPLQALVLLNDVQFVEAARAFAQRILRSDLADDRARLEWAFLEALARPASSDESVILLNALERERQRYRSQPDDAIAFLQVGESPADGGLDPVEHAAWSQVAQLLLNLSETITRN